MAGPEDRVLILAPVGRDGEMASDILAQAGFRTEVCADLDSLCAAMSDGAAVILLVQEALQSAGVVPFIQRLEDQPAWSALPLVLVTSGLRASSEDKQILRGLEGLRSVTFLERPVRIMTLVSAIQSAAQARQRQYQVRDLLGELERGVRYRDEFLAMLAHELRNPLAPIRNAAHFLQLNREQLDAQMQWAADVVERQSELLTQLVDDLLDVARITRGTVELRVRDVDMGEVIERAVETVHSHLERTGHRLIISVDEQCHRLRADPARLIQIIFNLLHNAGKYSDPGSRIWLAVAPQSDGHCAVSVRDEGWGIPHERLDTIFEIFLQGERGLARTEGGLGLGLALVRRLVELHGGSVSVHSDGPGKGSEFIVRLPLREGLAAPDAHAAAEARNAF